MQVLTISSVIMGLLRLPLSVPDTLAQLATRPALHNKYYSATLCNRMHQSLVRVALENFTMKRGRLLQNAALLYHELKVYDTITKSGA